MFGDLWRKFVDLVWGNSLLRYGWPGRFAAGLLRNLWAVIRDIASGQLNLRAMSLVYTTLLSVVPLIAVSFSALKAFGVDKYIEPRLYGLMEPLGPKGVEYTDRVMDLVHAVNPSVLGGIGVVFFIYTAISMVQKIEDAFNYVWYVSKSRSFGTRLIEYSTVLIVGAIAVGIAVKALVEFSKDQLVVSIQESTALAPVFTLTDRLMPYAITIGIFTFLYRFMPNTRVRFRSALVGGLAGGILWATTALIFASFIANSSNRQAIYASFAVAISTLLWLYLNWLILLIGSQVAFYYQNPAYLRIGRREPRLSNAMRERIALNVMVIVGAAFRDSNKSVDLHAVSGELRLPSLTIEPIIIGLESNGLLASTEDEKLIPGREMARITLADILNVVRVDGETGSHREPEWASVVTSVGESIDDAVSKVVENKTLPELLDEAEAA